MRAVLLLLTVACGGTTSLPEPLANRAAPPPRPPCTDVRIAAIAAHLQGEWNTRDAPAVRCTPGRFPTPGFYILADHQAGILADDGVTELVSFARRVLPPDTSIVDTATVDLDGDGIDEIVETWRHDTDSFTRNRLAIRRLAERTLVDIKGPHTNVDHDDLGGCTAQVRLAGQTIVVTVTHAPGLPPSDCLAAGTHAFALDAEKLVELRRVSRR